MESEVATFLMSDLYRFSYHHKNTSIDLESEERNLGRYSISKLRLLSIIPGSPWIVSKVCLPRMNALCAHYFKLRRQISEGELQQRE